jgi:hypothetical protein
MREHLTNLTATAAATLAENLDNANERTLEAVVEANRRFVELAVATADRVAEQFSFELPFADRLPTVPTPAESGERYLDFVERAVAVNREFNDRIVGMLKSDTATVDSLVATVTQAADTATDAVRATARTTSARTSTARKSASTRAASAKTAATTTAKRTAKKTASTARAASK